jgi:hypothetical protein
VIVGAAAQPAARQSGGERIISTDKTDLDGAEHVVLATLAANHLVERSPTSR